MGLFVVVVVVCGGSFLRGTLKKKVLANEIVESFPNRAKFIPIYALCCTVACFGPVDSQVFASVHAWVAILYCT